MSERALEIEQLGAHGYFVRDGFAGERTRATAQLATTLAFAPAGIRRSGDRDETVRSGETTWLDDSPLHAAFADLQSQLNRTAFLGLTRFDVQLARYEPGAHYSRHRDAFPGPGNRRVTAIVYLNDAWQPQHGGELRLHVDPPRDIEPVDDRLVVFLSDRVEHEVLPTTAVRFAITAWFYGP